MRLFLLLLLPVIFIQNLFSQTDFENYAGIKSTGKVPVEFRINQSSRYNEFKSVLSDNKELDKQGMLNKFSFFNSKALNSLYSSGFITFNDPISKYANSVLEYILKDDKDLLSKVRVYTIKSTETNAFTTADGKIFVSVGLLAQIQNEAQLAFVLSHELIHFIKKHHIENFVHTNDMINDRDIHISNEQKLKKLFAYSKENEFESDLEGYKSFYEKSGYSISEIENLFDVLLYSYLPIDEIKFDLSVFESDNYKFPEDYTLTKYNEITAIEDYNDANSSHPNILKRKEQILKAIAGKEQTNVKFIISEKIFNEVQKNARFELSNLYIISKDFEKAIYNSYILQKEYPANKYLKLNIAEALYGLTFNKNRNNFSAVHFKPEDIEGYSQQVSFLMDTLKKEEMNLLSLRYIWNLKTMYNNDRYIAQLSDSIMKETGRNIDVDILTFPLEYTEKTTISQDTVVNYEELSKTEKIKYKKQHEQNNEETEKYYTNSLIDLPDNKKLIERYVLIRDEKKGLYNEISGIYNKDTKNNKSKDSFTSKNLNLEKVILLNPIYNTKIKQYSNKEISKFYLKSDEFYKSINTIAEKLNLNIVELSHSSLSENDIDKINDYAIIMSWLYEIIYQDNSDYIPVNQRNVLEIIKKYDTKYFAWMSFNYSKSGMYYYDLYIFDLENTTLVSQYTKRFKKPYFDEIKSNMYYSMLKIKNDK